MNDSHGNRSDVVVAGFGSPHGDDQAGWRLVAMLERRHLPARIIAVYESTQLLEALRGCQHLIIVDACHSGSRVGAVTRFRWPDGRVAARHQHSTHGIGVCGLLELTERLGALPASVEIIGIEVADCQPGRDLSPAVKRAVTDLEAKIFDELREVVHARAVVGPRTAATSAGRGG